MKHPTFIDDIEALKIPIKKNSKLSELTSWKIGGPADFVVWVKTAEQLKSAVELARKHKHEFFPIGSGTNILASDEGFRGVVIKMRLDGVSISGNRVTAGSGAPLGKTAAMALQKDLSGLEWAIGIPGTVGGAVFGNSNCFGGSTGSSLESAKILSKEGEVMEKSGDYFRFGYDFSILQKTGEVLLEATFKLSKISPAETEKIRREIARTASVRFSSQPLGEATAGSTFKAVEPKPELQKRLKKIGLDWRKATRDGRISSGFLIDKALGLKGFTLGKMRISEKHANFFINLGGASAQNAKKLIDFVKKECKIKLDVVLEEEIRYLGKF